MKGFLKFIGVLAAIAVILYLVYAFVLPTNLKEMVDYNAAMLTNKDAKAAITAIQDAKPTSSEHTYKDIFETSSKYSRWEYVSGAGITNDKVIFTGEEVTITLEGVESGDEVHNKEILTVEFDIMANGSYNMKILLAGKEVKQNKKTYVIEYLDKSVK